MNDYSNSFKQLFLKLTAGRKKLLVFHMLYFLRLQNQVGEVIDVMKDNVNKVMDRGYKLEELQDRSGMLFIFHFII